MNEALAHLAGDYVVQSDWMAMEKTSHALPAAAHAATYAACFLPLTRDPRALAVIGGTHYLIDRYRLAKYVCWAKNQLAPERHRYPWKRPASEVGEPFARYASSTGYDRNRDAWMTVWLMIITDNTMHLAANHWALRRWAR